MLANQCQELPRTALLPKSARFRKLLMTASSLHNHPTAESRTPRWWCTGSRSTASTVIRCGSEMLMDWCESVALLLCRCVGGSVTAITKEFKFYTSLQNRVAWFSSSSSHRSHGGGVADGAVPTETAFIVATSSSRSSTGLVQSILQFIQGVGL